MWQNQNHQIARVDGKPDRVPSQVVENGNTADVAAASAADGVNGVNDVSKSLSEVAISPATNGVCSPPEMPQKNDDHPQNHPQAQTMAQNFAMEHRIFLRACLDLLTERDQLSMEADVNGPNTIKTGSLRKASHRIKGLWKTKYVEIRKGTFSYFDDNVKQRNNSNDRAASLKNEQKVLRKDIPLRASACTCRAVKIRSVKILPHISGGAVFELRIQGGSRRLWMANTREERQSWIQAIHNAMIGASVTRGDNFLEYQMEGGDAKKHKSKSNNNLPLNSPYRTSLDQYLNVREATQSAQSKDEYLSALSCLRGRTITIPVQWMKSQLDDTPAAASFMESGISHCVEQLWKDLLRDSVEINGEVLAGESFHGPDRIVGKLTQQILSSDALLRGTPKRPRPDWEQSRITEAQAISYARDILLASDRTRSGGDSYFCAENLCLNRDLVVLCPTSTEAKPLSIRVSECQRKGSEDLDSANLSGWVSARSRSTKPWKKQYVVLEDFVLSCYTEAEPKPHRLLEQVMLYGTEVSSSSHHVQNTKHASMTPSNGLVPEYIVKIATKDGRVVHEYLFEDELDFLFWHEALKKSACSLADTEDRQSNSTKNPNGTGNACTTPSSAVDAVINVCTEYKMCTLDPSGIESEDTWAVLRTKFVQKLSLTGGPNGRISRGDEVVELDLL